MDWAEDACPELKQFAFVFLILLRYINNDSSLESVILEQHGRLKTMRVSLSEMKAILEGETENNILLLMDGYDEYTAGINKDVDDIIINGRENCLVIVSSRSGDFLQPIRMQADHELLITGFSDKNVRKCAELYLGSKEICDKFLVQAEKASLYNTDDLGDDIGSRDLLHIPIILLMACTIFKENKSLSSSKTGIFGQIIQMSISRTTLKTMRKSASEIQNLQDLKIQLGKLACVALQRETRQLLIYKVSVELSTN